MSWKSATRKAKTEAPKSKFVPRAFSNFRSPEITPHEPVWSRLVSIDFETYYDPAYTLKKLSTSEYVRDPRFKAQMMGIKIGNGPTRVIPANRIKTELLKINWSTHALLCHNTQFDGFILSHHYGVCPAFYYDTLSMARGLHSNEIGAGLDAVSLYYGGRGKIENTLEKTSGVLNWSKELTAEVGIYCANDVDEMVRVFKLMLPSMPSDEIDLINLTCRMFCKPMLEVDIPRVEKELERELKEREQRMYAAVDPDDWDSTKILTKKEQALTGVERDMLIIKRVIGSNEKFADLLRAEGVEPPVKISPAWMKRSKDERLDETGKYTYAFAKDDEAFTSLPHRIEAWGFDLNDPDQVAEMVLKQERLQALVDARISVKSTTNITRAERFLIAGNNGMKLPIGYAYYRAHCLTGDAEVLTRQGWVRLDSWNGGDIAQWSADGAIKFIEATANVFHIDEEVVVANSRYHQAVYTKGHNVPGFTSSGAFVPRKAGAAGKSRFSLPISGELHGCAPITALEARLAVMVQADGCIRTDTKSGRCVRFGFKKLRKITRCKDMLNEANVVFNESIEPNGTTRIYVPAGEMHKLLGLLTEDTKQFSPLLLEASLDVKHAFIDELTHWDGDVEPHRKGFTYSTTNKSNAGIVQTIAHLSGQSAFISQRARKEQWATSYRVYIRSDRVTRSEPKHYSTRHHTGAVYCPTTQTGYFLMRQGGHIVVTGNTGRWGGQNKMNMQNLKRGGELRLSILAPKGRMMAVQDSGQIEARVNGWLWGQQDLLDGFRAADTGTGKDAYCNFADIIYARNITKADKTERFVGKVCVLGLGFQMGAQKLMITLAKGALGGPPVHFSLDQCLHIINAYRRKNSRIAAGWAKCQEIIEAMADGREGSYGPLNWEANTIWLPNGMALKYPDLKKQQGDKGWDEWTYQSGDMRKKIYGGLLCENIVQALARIIVAWQMLQIDKKYPVVMTTHDEIVALPTTRQAETCIQHMEKCMSTPPAWCPDIPLNCEGGYAANYSK